MPPTSAPAAVPAPNRADERGAVHADAWAVAAEAERLYALDNGLSPGEADRRVVRLVESAALRFAAAGRWEQVFRVLAVVPLVADVRDTQIPRLRCHAQLREYQRVARLRRRLLGLLGAVVVYLFAASPTLFITLDNPERVSRGMAVLDWSEGLYWSVITFCTVGYGDVVPLTPYARMLSLFNASLGVTLMGVVAGLILGWLTPRRV